MRRQWWLAKGEGMRGTNREQSGMFSFIAPTERHGGSRAWSVRAQAGEPAGMATRAMDYAQGSKQVAEKVFLTPSVADRRRVIVITTKPSLRQHDLWASFSATC
jgi:hypothetical protein